jgi:hypothetical protein
MRAIFAAAVVLVFQAAAQDVSVAAFQADVTPPIGSPLCGGAVMPVRGVDDPLTSRGIVILPRDQAAIVLCAVDYTGIANRSHDVWRAALAEAAQTSPDRVAVHCLHQHDAPELDDSSEALLASQGMSGVLFNVEFAREAMQRTARAVAEAIQASRPITGVGFGQAEVIDVASNRRVLGPDGKVKWIRWSATTDAEARAQPVGAIDPLVRAVSFWDGDTPVAVLTYYATHPQSYYGGGQVSWDFPGMARRQCEESSPGVAWIHFNGAGGNITAGKYNDGNPANRPILADRLADGMKKAWANTTKRPLAGKDVRWATIDVALPPRPEIVEAHERAVLADYAADPTARRRAAVELAWLERCRVGHRITLARLQVADIAVMHMPGELFVEYQLGAQRMRADSPVCMAAYGDYGMGYIGTAVSYTQGGYETGLYVSRTAPGVEQVLLNAMQELLGQK